MSPKKPDFPLPLRPEPQLGGPVEKAETRDAGRPDAVIRHRVSELLRGAREAILEHRGQEYRLRITATGKLILTK